MYKALHLRDDTDHESRKEGEGGITSTEDSVEATIWELNEYRKKSKEN